MFNELYNHFLLHFAQIRSNFEFSDLKIKNLQKIKVSKSLVIYWLFYWLREWDLPERSSARALGGKQ